MTGSTMRDSRREFKISDLSSAYPELTQCLAYQLFTSSEINLKTLFELLGARYDRVDDVVNIEVPIAPGVSNHILRMIIRDASLAHSTHAQLDRNATQIIFGCNTRHEERWLSSQVETSAVLVAAMNRYPHLFTNIVEQCARCYTRVFKAFVVDNIDFFQRNRFDCRYMHSCVVNTVVGPRRIFKSYRLWDRVQYAVIELLKNDFDVAKLRYHRGDAITSTEFNEIISKQTTILDNSGVISPIFAPSPRLLGWLKRRKMLSTFERSAEEYDLVKLPHIDARHIYKCYRIRKSRDPDVPCWLEVYSDVRDENPVKTYAINRSWVDELRIS